jgi:hypothetical protein
MSELPTNIQSTLGALEIGVFIALFLFGIVTAQASVYYQRFPQDRVHIKALVCHALLLSSSLTSVSSRETGCSYLVTAPSPKPLMVFINPHHVDTGSWKLGTQY